MKSFKRYIQEKALGNNASFSSAGSDPTTKFSGIMGFGSVSGDAPAAPAVTKKPGKGGGKDINPEITKAINYGVKTNSIVKDEKTGSLNFRGVDGKLYNSPHSAIAASYASYSNAGKNVFPPMINAKVAEYISELEKSGQLFYDYDSNGVVVSQNVVKDGRVYRRGEGETDYQEVEPIDLSPDGSGDWWPFPPSEKPPPKPKPKFPTSPFPKPEEPEEEKPPIPPPPPLPEFDDRPREWWEDIFDDIGDILDDPRIPTWFPAPNPNQIPGQSLPGGVRWSWEF